MFGTAGLWKAAALLAMLPPTDNALYDGVMNPVADSGPYGCMMTGWASVGAGAGGDAYMFTRYR